jgi:hypothetical protein
MDSRHLASSLSVACALSLLTVTACGGAPGEGGSDDPAGSTEQAASGCHHATDWNLPRNIDGNLCITKSIRCDPGGGGCVRAEVCTGSYAVNHSTYDFTQSALGICPAPGTRLDLTSAWAGNTLLGFEVTNPHGGCGGAGIW